MKENIQEKGRSSIIQDIHVGDLVELIVDGKFFGRNDGGVDRYGAMLLL